jgi:hypothetical protein
MIPNPCFTREKDHEPRESQEKKTTNSCFDSPDFTCIFFLFVENQENKTGRRREIRITLYCSCGSWLNLVSVDERREKGGEGSCGLAYFH